MTCGCLVQASVLPGTGTLLVCPINQQSGHFPCWGICDGAAGHRSQVTGLCASIGLPHEVFEVHLKLPWRRFPSALVPVSPFAFREADRLRENSPPRVLVTCGKQTVAASLLCKQRFGAGVFTVHLQHPHVDLNQFDLIVAPEHDGLSGPNVVSTLGAMHPVTREVLEFAVRRGPGGGLETLTAPFVAVLLGGPNRYYAFDERDVNQLAGHLEQVADSGRQLVIVPSRRTPEAAVANLRKRFGAAHFIWNGEKENPYLAALALSSHIVVTGDSVSMVSEATATGKPVLVEFLQEKRAARKFRAFHESLQAAGIIRRFTGELASWVYEPPQPTLSVAEIVRARLGLGPARSVA